MQPHYRSVACSLLAILTATLPAAAEPAADKPASEKAVADKPDSERILGKWNLKESDRPNNIFNAEGTTVELTFEEMKFEFSVLKDGGKILHIPGTYFIDDKQTPKLLDITLSGDGGSNSVYAIYEFKDDQLRIRIRDNNGQRPADFESAAADCQLLTFARPESK